MIHASPAWAPLLRRHRSRRGRRPVLTQVGWCVRMDWPDGTHTLAGFTPRLAVAVVRVASLRRFWARGPVSPLCLRVVTVSRHDWRLHAERHGCASPGCPS